MDANKDISALKELLNRLKSEGRVLLAYLYGSYASGAQHARSDIDLAIYLNAADEGEAVGVIDDILMASGRHIEILRLDDKDESPFVVQEALKGIPLIEPDMETLYKVAHQSLHEAESIRHRRTCAQG